MIGNKECSAMKKILLLQGLDCANCAAKIETQSNNIKGINSVTVDFVSKKMSIEIADENEFSKIFGEITAIVNKIEPDVKVIDTTKNKSNKDIIMLEGLGCANCASKMETAIKNLDGVTFASVDFRKLQVQVGHSHGKN